MSPAAADDTTPAPLDDAAYQRALAVLLDVGTSIAKELKTPTPSIPVTARAAAFDRIALAVRRTIILSRHIAERPCAHIAAEARRVAARQHVLRAVEDVIEDRADPADAPQLRVELVERVDSLDFEADLANRSPDEIIRELCRDLGLANIRGALTYRRRTPDDIAILCAAAAAPAGSGLPQWLTAASGETASPPPPRPT